VFEFEKPRALY